MHDRKHRQLIQRRQEISKLLERHHDGDEKLRIALTALVTLTQAPQTFLTVRQLMKMPIEQTPIFELRI